MNISSKAYSVKDQAELMKKLAFLLNAGIPLLQSIYTILDREEREYKKRLIRKVINNLTSGMSVHKSFEVMPPIFDQNTLQMIKVTEMSGTLAKGTEKLALELEARLADRRSLMGTLMYPIFILVFAFLLIVFLLGYIFPKILPFLNSLNTPLPLPTRILFGSYSFFKEYGIIISVSFITMILIGLLAYARSRMIKKMSASLILNAPLIGNALKIRLLHSSIRLLATFLESGYTLVEGLFYISEFETNIIYKEMLNSIQIRIKDGEKFSRVLTTLPNYFKSEAIQFISIGEETGRLSATLAHLARFYNEEIKAYEKKFSTLLEPSLMIFLGIIVGFIALSLITPIYSITSSVSASIP